MNVSLSCPQAVYKADMRIWCTKAEGWCGNQYFKRCKGWWVLNDEAGRCPLRKEKAHGQDQTP